MVSNKEVEVIKHGRQVVAKTRRILKNKTKGINRKSTTSWVETLKTKTGDVTKTKHLMVPTIFRMRMAKLLKTNPFLKKEEKHVSTNDLQKEIIWYLKDVAKQKVRIKKEENYPKAFEKILLKIWESGGMPRIVLCPDSETKNVLKKVHKEPQYFVDDELIDEILIFDSLYLDIYTYGKKKDKNTYGIIHRFPKTVGYIEVK